MKCLIVIPAYNEQEALAKTVAGLESLSADYDVVIVNDGSTDRTGEIAEQLSRSDARSIRVVHLPMNCGVGPAMQTGYRLAARSQLYDYVIQFDADGQHDPEYLDALVTACQKQQLDLCIGSRFLGDTGSYKSSRPRRLGMVIINWLVSVLSGQRVTDATGGFRCAGRRAWSHFAHDYPEDYAEPESLFWCARNKLRIGEIPVRMHERQGGVSSIHFFKAIYYMVKVSVALIIERLRTKEHQVYDA